jgi:hypothetical protein
MIDLVQRHERPRKTPLIGHVDTLRITGKHHSSIRRKYKQKEVHPVQMKYGVCYTVLCPGKSILMGAG